MSRKFVPSFLKEQGNTAVAGAGAGVGAGAEPTQTRAFINTNKFAPLSDDRHINTSRPAKEAPKLAPATLASATFKTLVVELYHTCPLIGFDGSDARTLTLPPKI